LQQFVPLVESRGDAPRAAAYAAESQRLRNAVEENAWDGRWYRRAYFDDGTPLGSAQNDECQIDSLVQSWSVIAGGDPQRSRTAMQAAHERLVRPEDHLVQLLDPPFDKTPLDPGYIKGYPPGIRENGGQYTHAAAWFVQALTMLGNGTDAVKTFDLLNPIRSASPTRATNYRVEPYVVAADVYSTPPHIGRGGWTWYTGSAGWIYRVAIECILGVRLRGNRLTLSPCIPADWPGFEICLRRGSTTWHISVENPDGVECGETKVTIDGGPAQHREVILNDDGQSHRVQAVLIPVKSTRVLSGNGEASLDVPEPHSSLSKVAKRIH
jgi:cyclic beta-1,2-glucan synthetase